MDEASKSKRFSNPRGGKRDGAGSGGAREGAGRKRRLGNYKTRNWATVIYPESAKEGWRDILRGWCCQALLSPLHDKDKDPTGEPKKAHYHLMVMYDGPKGQALMEERFAELGGVGCQPCNSARGYARYLCHMDNPEKYQYPVEDVETFGGANYLDIIALESDRRQTISEMCEWCLENHCISFRQLCDYARKERPTWWQAITSNSTMIMFRYLRSLEDDYKREAQAEMTAFTEAAECKCRERVQREEAERPRLSPLEEARHRAEAARRRLEEALYAVAALEEAAGESEAGTDGTES